LDDILDEIEFSDSEVDAKEYEELIDFIDIGTDEIV
jgi:hypothetical protein